MTMELINSLKPNQIFVFDSNLLGKHDKGAALYARKHFGAVYGHYEGISGQTYALPTKGLNLEPLKLESIDKFVQRFLSYARNKPELEFLVTPIGCGLAGYKPEDIAPMFKDCPSNVILPDEFANLLKNSHE